MSDDVRYVLRYKNTDGKVCYDGHGDSEHLSHAEKYTIRELNARLLQLFEMQRVRAYPIRQIVRVRCVIGEDQWRLATPEEAERFGYSYEYPNSENKVYRFAPHGNDESSPVRHLRIRVPGEPRWEVMDE
jgi:hypothetical protein